MDDTDYDVVYMDSVTPAFGGRTNGTQQPFVTSVEAGVAFPASNSKRAATTFPIYYYIDDPAYTPEYEWSGPPTCRVTYDVSHIISHT